MQIFLSFDFDADAAEHLYFRDKPVKKSRARFGTRALQRILSILKKHSILTTFFIPGWTAEKYRDLVNDIVQHGHEIAMHGYMHEKLDTLTYEEELEVHKKALSVLGVYQNMIYGFRRPYFEISKNTLSIISDLGIIYDSSLMDSEEPYLLKVGDNYIVELPVYDIFDDWLLFEMEHRTPHSVLNFWKYELESYIEADLEYFCLILHPACIGRTGRIKILEEFIIFAKNKKCIFADGYSIAKRILQKCSDKNVF